VSRKGKADDVKKRRKIGGPSEAEILLMNKLFTDVNALKSDMGEDLNTYFLKPVDKKVS
jgi:ATP-dependent helicase STH1/SNF2